MWRQPSWLPYSRGFQPGGNKHPEAGNHVKLKCRRDASVFSGRQDAALCGRLGSLPLHFQKRSHGTERMRQKLFVAKTGTLVNTSAPNEPAGLVACGIQLAGDRLPDQSSA
jgi:hypothetical protein